MRANLGEVKEANYEPLPQGKYHVRVVMADGPITDAKKLDGTLKAPHVKTRFQILSGEYAGRFIFKDFIFTEKALPFLKPFLVALGYPTDQEVEIVPDQWVNEQLVVQVAHELKDGKPKDVPAMYYSLQSQSIVPLSSEEIPFGG